MSRVGASKCKQARSVPVRLRVRLGARLGVGLGLGLGVAPL
jgi:hypothetical protein